MATSEKGSVTVVVKEKIWDAVIGLKNVHLSIVVIIKGNHPNPLPICLAIPAFSLTSVKVPS